MGEGGQTWAAPVAAAIRSQTMKNFLKNFVRDENGAAAAEYALILAIVGTGIAFAAFTLGGNISTAIGRASTCIAAAAPTAGC